MPVGNSIVYPIDDVLIPTAVTINLHDALAAYGTGSGRQRDVVAQQVCVCAVKCACVCVCARVCVECVLSVVPHTQQSMSPRVAT